MCLRRIVWKVKLIDRIRNILEKYRAKNPDKEYENILRRGRTMFFFLKNPVLYQTRKKKFFIKES